MRQSDYQDKCWIESSRKTYAAIGIDSVYDQVLERTVQVPVLLETGIEGFRTELGPERSNRDLPDELAFVEQGTHTQVNSHIDLRIADKNSNDRPILRRRMDAAHFREHCVQRGGSNHFLFEKGRVNFDVQQHLRPEWLQSKLEIDWSDAVSLAEFLRRMRFDRKTVLKLIFGHMAHQGDPASARRGGLQSIGDKNEMAETVALFESIAEALPELADERLAEAKSLEEERIGYSYLSEDMHFDSIFDRIDYIETAARESVDIGGCINPFNVDRMVNLGFESVDQPQVDDEKLVVLLRCLPLKSLKLHEFTSLLELYKSAIGLEMTGRQLREKVLMQTVAYAPFDSNPYSSTRLYHGEDAIDWELVLEIKNADINDRKEPDPDYPDDPTKKITIAGLKTIMQRMYPKVNRYTGAYTPARYNYFTPLQRTSFWSYINARRQQIAEQYRSMISPHTAKMIALIRKLGPKASTKALIMAYRNGGDFETDTEYFEFDATPRPKETDMYVLWAEYRAMEKNREIETIETIEKGE